MTRFIVMIDYKAGLTPQEAFGIYRSFKRAEDDAKAIPPNIGTAYVLPLKAQWELP